MPFPYDADDLAAIDRLANFYNGGDYDASTNPGGMGRGGHRVNFESALTDAARAGAANAAAATAAGSSATAAGVSEVNAAASAAKLIGSSATSVAIGLGSKTLTTQSGKFFAPGTFLIVFSAANPTANSMAGQVSAYSGTDLTVDVTSVKGSGTFDDWVIAVAGAPGGQGLPGLQGPIGPTPDIMVTFSNGVTDSDPGNGLLKFNNASPASTTQLYVDNLDRYGTGIASWLDSFDDSTNTALRGAIKLVQVSDPTRYARFNVVGAVVDGSGYRKVPVSHVVSNGAFTNGAILAVDFVRTGDKGLDGDGAGDVLGPASATDNHVALFDGSTGKLLKSGGALSNVATSGEAADVTFAAGGGITATDVQAAIVEVYASAISLPTGYFNGFPYAQDPGDLSNDIVVRPGSARDIGDSADLILTVDCIKQIDAVFAEYTSPGTPSGGRYSGDNLTGAKWFRKFMIGGAGKNTQPFFATAAVPTLPTGFSWWRRTGWIWWNGSNIKAFIQSGRDFQFTNPSTLDIDTATLGTTAQLVTVVTPPQKGTAILQAASSHASAFAGVRISDPDAVDLAPAFNAAPLATIGGGGGVFTAVPVRVVTNASAEVRVRAANANTTFRMVTLGWVDHV